MANDGTCPLGWLRKLAEGAATRRGHGNSDIYYGVGYENMGDVDEEPIPPGHVYLYGPGVPSTNMEEWEAVIGEKDYLSELTNILRSHDLIEEADSVEKILGEL